MVKITTKESTNVYSFFALGYGDAFIDTETSQLYIKINDDEAYNLSKNRVEVMDRHFRVEEVDLDILIKRGE